MPEKVETILLIDANALIHRAFHAFPVDLTTQEGLTVNAAYGFTKLLLQLLEEFKPKYIMCAFDPPGKTFRHESYADYKAKRPKMDERLAAQFPLIKEILTALNIPVRQISGLEADDVLGTIANHTETRGLKKIIVTGDRDLLQLINDDIGVYLAGNAFSKSILYTPANIQDKLGFTAERLIEFKGLRGDSSDNIPGVKGIGDKSALDLVREFDTLENIYANLEKLPNRIKSKLENDQKMAFFSRELATIKVDAQIDFDIQEAELEKYNYQEAVDLFTKLQFRSLIIKLPKQNGKQQLEQAKVIEKRELRLNHLQSTAQIQQFLEEDHKDEFWAVRFDSTKNVFDRTIKGLVISGAKDSYYLELAELDSQTTKILHQKLLTKKLVTFDVKDFYHSLASLSWDNLSVFFDIQIAAYLLSAGMNKTDLISLKFDYLAEHEEQKLVHDEKDSMQEAGTILAIFEILLQKLEQSPVVDGGWGLKKLFYELELPLARCLAEVELAGIKLNIPYLQEQSSLLDTEILRLQKSIYDQAGQEFNMNSPKQMAEILFEKLGLPAGKKNKSGSYSTNEQVLRTLQTTYPIVSQILEYRELSKLRSTYTDPLINQVNPVSGHIHTTYNQAATATGRLSSINPNLQNIPIGSGWGQKIRKAFEADAGKMFIFFDYSQQELRILANLSEEEKLVAAFEKGEDIHALTASALFNKGISEVTKDERRFGKTVNFGVVYGISSFGLAERLQISRQEGQRFIDTFYANYPKVRKYFMDLISYAKLNEYISTKFGRKKSTQGLRANNFNVRAATEREIINFPLQGNAADMMKMAMLRMHLKLKKDYPDFAHIVLQIHDELVISVNTTNSKDAKLKRLVTDVKEIMLGIMDFKLPMMVNAEFGFNLSEVQEL